MSFWSNVLGSMNPVRWFSPKVTYLGGTPSDGYGLPNKIGMADINFSALSVADLWASQPHLRTVVSFRARNVAQIGLHVFERVSDTDRERDHETPLAQALSAPDFEATTFDTIFALIGDLDLHDRAYWLLFEDEEGKPRIRRIPPTWVSKKLRNPWETDHYLISLGKREAKVHPDQVVEFSGYAPGSPDGVSPTIDSLRETLREQVEAARYRAQIWKRGGRVSSVLQRPADAPAWTPEQAERFRQDWYANYTGSGPNAGGTPILEDGMTLNRIDFSARDQQYVESSKLSLSTVASAFHVNPTMVGQMEGANYSNVREFRRMLYGDSLGPTLKQIEDVINQKLIPRLGLDPARYYAEFNIGQKLSGSFEEQAQVMQTMVGAPIMTRNEGRSRFNLPSVGDEGDELITPLNVLEGGQASPTDSGSQNVTGEAAGRTLTKSDDVTEVRFKAALRYKDHEDELEDVFADFFAKQRQAVNAQLFVKSPDWWDNERWNDELTELILTASSDVVFSVAGDALNRMGISEDEFDLNRTTAFRRSVAERIAGQVNDTTLEQIVEALDEPGEDMTEREAVNHSFDVSTESRAAMAGITAATTFAGFAVLEAARQTRPRARKRWIVTSTNPRASHAAMAGEEVGIDDNFSNGLPWPGSYSTDVDEVANCRCEISIVVDTA